ncbi:MAG: SLC13 family permease [Candidatus Hermodarchaeota archaeon]
MSIRSLITLAIFLLVIVLILISFITSSDKKKKRFFLRIDYSTAPLLGLLLLILTFSIDLEVISRGILGTERIKPFSIILLFFSLAYICISLDLTGLFEYMALKVAKGAGNSGIKLFIFFFLFSSILTTFTSNDIVILTITPIIIYFAKHTKIDPIPYLISQFFAANIWSLTLYIGNPTNIIVAEAFGLTFLEYSAWMLLPTLLGGFTCLILLLLVFKKRIPKSFESPDIKPRTALKDRFGATFGLILFISCLFMISIAQLLNLSLWAITFFFAIIMLCYNLIHDYILMKKKNLNNFFILEKSAKRIPWKIIPFIIGMFILVEALVSTGWIDLFARSMSLFSLSLIPLILIMGFLSSLSCNIMNNQPMTILFTQILLSNSFNVVGLTKMGSMFALIIGSNLGANLTLIGALAGIMWHKILYDNEVKISYKEFAKYGFLITPIIILLTCFTLSMELIL